MKSIVTLLLILLFANFMAFSQEIVLTFASAADSITIDSVQALNLKTNQKITIAGNESLILSESKLLGVDNSILPSNMVVYPNPCTESATLKVNSRVAQKITVKITNMAGQTVLQTASSVMPGEYVFYVSCANEGVYLATIQKSDGTESIRFIQSCKGSNKIAIGSSKYASSLSNLVTSSNHTEKDALLKGAKLNNKQLMEYKSNDGLMFTFYAGIYKTVVTTTPTESATITAEFLKCVDADNNSYPVVKIGNQWWMAKNLSTTHYNNGDAIPTDIVDTAWVKLKTGAYSCYLKNPKYIPNYGLLYNWFAASDERGVCPVGWHLSSDEEWLEMLNYLGSPENAGGELKATGTEFWLTPNIGATNSTGFSALPSSGRNIDGVLYNDGRDCYYWLANERDTTYAYNRLIYFNHIRVPKVFHTKVDGFAVRCVKDE